MSDESARGTGRTTEQLKELIKVLTASPGRNGLYGVHNRGMLDHCFKLLMEIDPAFTINRTQRIAVHASGYKIFFCMVESMKHFYAIVEHQSRGRYPYAASALDHAAKELLPRE